LAAQEICNRVGSVSAEKTIATGTSKFVKRNIQPGPHFVNSTECAIIL
jgi:hypothetical protein